MPRYQVYAPPDQFGDWTTVANPLGRVSYTITVEPIGDTLITGEVRYFGEGDIIPRVDSFSQEVSIQTGDSVATVDVHLKGTPTGSSCWVDVTP